MLTKKMKFNYFFILFLLITVFKFSLAFKNIEEIFNSDELKIDIYPENKQKEGLQKKSLKNIIDENSVKYSFDSNEELAFINKNVPFLEGLYYAHINHLPVRIKPDDIWLLIVQAFCTHVNENSEKLRKYFVDFEGKKTLEINYTYNHPIPIELFPYEDFPIQINEEMKKYLGNEIVDDLTANFTTTDYNSYLVSKLSIMGSFKKYFDYVMHIEIVCGSPYIILEGTEDDYKSIISKAKKLRKYEFEWYIDRIIPCVEKMVEAKKGNIDIEFFKNIIQHQHVGFGCGGSTEIFGWIIKFLYRQEQKCTNKKEESRFRFFSEEDEKKFKIQQKVMPEDSRLIKDELIKFYCMDISEFSKLSSQMLIVPFKVKYEDKTRNIYKEYDMKYKVGFIGCDQNEKSEVYPVQGWIVSLGAEEEKPYREEPPFEYFR